MNPNGAMLIFTAWASRLYWSNIGSGMLLSVNKGGGILLLKENKKFVWILHSKEFSQVILSIYSKN